MVLCVLLLFLLFTTTVNASTFEVSGQPSEIDASTPFNVSFTFTCSTCDQKNNYFIGVFKHVDSTYQFGQTLVNDEWVDYETIKDATKYITASPSAEFVWSGTLQVKAINPDNLSSRFKGEGQYVLRILRFTPNSTSNKVEVPIKITYITPPTPTPHPTPTPTPEPSPTPKPTPVATATPFIRPSPTPIRLTTSNASASTALYYGQEETDATIAGAIETANHPVSQIGEKKTNTIFIPLLFVFGSLLIVIGIVPVGLRMFSTPSRDTIDK